MKYIALIYLAFVALLSAITFAAYGFDKRRARQDGRRIPEKTLHIMAILGGWPGGFAGQRTFRHKTKKVSFQIAIWLCVAFHVIVVGGIVYVWIRSR
mgnify:CR=1 FL=1